MKKIRGFFSSIILTVVLAVLICIVAAIGSIITIEHPAVMSYLNHKVLIYGLKELSPRFEIYWIIVLTFLIALFALNTFVCTLDKITSIVKNRGNWRRLLPQIVHIGFLIALTGHLIGSVSGFKTSGNVLFKDELTPIAAVRDLSVRLDDFTAKNNSYGYRDYMKTTISLFRDNVKILTGDIAVNHPLIYKGIAFYHNDDGEAPDGIKVKINGLSLNLPFNGEPSDASSEGLRVTGLYPDFALDKDGRPYSRSERFTNPYARLTMGKKSAFLNISGQGRSITINGKKIEYNGFTLRPYVVLNINKDPGIWLIITGSLVLLAGMILLLIFGRDKAELIRPRRVNTGAPLREN
jgi:cytochrome c biogenesis protein ResB